MSLQEGAKDLNHIQIALKKYESKRMQIYKELEISYVQDKIRRRLLSKDLTSNVKVEEPIEFLFFQEKEDFAIEDLISDDCNISKLDDIQADSIDAHIADESSDSSEVIERKAIRKSDSKISKFLDIEADISGEYDEEDSFIDNENISEEAKYIDNDVDSNINLDIFADERERNNEKLLKDLKNKFVKKKVVTKETKIDPIHIESNDDFPEIADLGIEISSSTSEVNEVLVKEQHVVNSKEEGIRKLLFEDDSLFNNDSQVLQRISKKEDKKVSGFVEKKV